MIYSCDGKCKDAQHVGTCNTDMNRTCEASVNKHDASCISSFKPAAFYLGAVKSPTGLPDQACGFDYDTNHSDSIYKVNISISLNPHLVRWVELCASDLVKNHIRFRKRFLLSFFKYLQMLMVYMVRGGTRGRKKKKLGHYNAM